MMGFKVVFLSFQIPKKSRVSKQWWDLKLQSDDAGRGTYFVLVNNDGI